MAVSYQDSKAAMNAASTFSVNDEEDYILCSDGRYEIYSYYYDTQYSLIDDLKNVTMDSSQINVTQETNSQFVPFKIKRFWDGIDLMQMFIQIHYQNSAKQGSVSNAVNVRYSDNYITFGWLVDSNVTAKAGEVTFEIMATGVNEKGNNYIWKTRPNGKLSVLESLSFDGIIEPTEEWYTGFVNTMLNYVSEAQTYAELAKQEAGKLDEDKIGENVKTSVMPELEQKITEALEDYYTKEEINDFISELNSSISGIDSLLKLSVSYDDTTGSLEFKNGEKQISKMVINSLNNLKVDYEVVNGKGTLKFYNKSTELFSVELSSIEPSAQWAASFKEGIEEEFDEKISGVQESINESTETISGIDERVQSLEEYNENNAEKIDKIDENASAISALENKVKIVESGISGNSSDIDSINQTIGEIDEKLSSLGEIKTNEYDVTYSENVFTLYENDSIKKQFTIVGGGGGGSVDTSTITVERLNGDNIIVLSGEKALIEFNYTSVDNTGDSTGNAKVSWKVGNTNVTTSTAVSGRNVFDITDYVKNGANSIRATFTDGFGTISSKTWTVAVVEFVVESIFDDSLLYNDDITVRYTPYGDITKTVHFKLDGVEIGQEEVKSTGRQLTYKISKRNHGAHLLEIYMTATINEKAIRSASVYKDIIWVEEGNITPIIGCAITEFTEKQYNTKAIPYVVYDPKNNPANIQLIADGVVVSNQKIDRAKQTWSYKSEEFGQKNLAIVCGEVRKEITANIEELQMDAKPVTTGLVLDFNPSGKTNAETDWLKINDSVSISVSENFDTTNGGYQIDEDGDTYFCVKAGTKATIPFKLFEDDTKLNGKNFKFIYKTANVKDYDATVMTCIDSGIGFNVMAQQATLSSEQKSITVPYCEENYMELEFNILPDSEFTEMVMWIDGIPAECQLYSSSDNFTQPNPSDLVIGSDDCDVNIYRIKAYNMNLTDDEILDNRITDAKNANEMISRYSRNLIVDDYGEIDPDVLAENCPDLRVIKLSCPHFTTGKKNTVDGCTIQQIYKGGREKEDNWTATGAYHKGQGTSSDGYGESARNIDICCQNGFELSDGSVVSKYAMTENSVEENYFNIKVNVASSENANNAVLADDYNTFNPYIRQARKNNPKVRDTMEFHPCVIFLQETDPTTAEIFHDGKYHFYACGDFGNSKTNNATMGMDADNHKETIIEVSNNTNDLGRFLSKDFSNEKYDGDGAFEPRYPKDFKGYSEEEVAAIKQAWQKTVSWVVDADKETFKREFEEHFVKDSVLFFYLFTERHCMVDNRAKNTFWHTEDLKHWDICFNYDNDTGEGNDNEGGLTLTYGYEDADMIGTKAVFNAHDSKLWCYVRDCFADELQQLYIQLESKLAWNANRILKKFEDYQGVKPERLWIADMRRKYFRTYEENGTTTYLENMMHGTKTHQRRQFEKYQHKYIASKYKGAAAIADVITIRGYTPENWKGVKPDGTFHIRPYADTYILAKYGNVYGTDGENSTKIRGKRGQTYTINCPIDAMNDTEVYVYNASIVQSIGDISAFYPGYTDFGQAVKLTDIHVGSNVEDYSNTNMNNFDIGNNTLLEKLNLQNVPNLAKTIDLNGCVNLEEFLADGSGITGVIFAPGGKIKKAVLPAISSLSAKKLSHLDELTILDYSNITSLIIEDCSSIDTFDLYNKCENVNRLRFSGIDWNLEDTTILDEIAKLKGYDDKGYNANVAYLSGTVHVPVMRQQKLDQYAELWEDLKVTYDTIMPQFTVTFINEDRTVLDVQYVDKGSKAVDPITRKEDPISVPTKESTISTDYTYAGWNDTFDKIFMDRVITATYSESVRKYTVKYVSKGLTLQETTAPYGDIVSYDGDTPVYTAEESGYKYNLFNKWDKSGLVDGDKTINAIFETCEYSQGYFDGKSIEDMTEVELYALMKLGLEQDIVEIKDEIEFKLGIDYSFEDIEEKELISETMNFDGNNYLDTGIKLMDEDRDFTFAIDFEMSDSSQTGGVLAQCYQEDGANGFRLWYNGSPKISWGTSNTDPAMTNKREILVLSHKKGEQKVSVYKSNLSGDRVVVESLDAIRIPVSDAPIVFGCSRADDGYYEKYAKGKIHWCKIWYAALGEKECKDVASWIHESIPMEVAKFRGYYLSDTASKRSSITFIAKNLLGTTRQFSNTSTNEGGWKHSSLNSWMNNRLYNAISPLWKSLIKRVKISSSAGLKSSDILTDNSYFYIPSIYELDGAYGSDPYIGETSGTIPYMINNENRKRAKTYSKDVCEEYFTRSPNVGYNNYIYGITSDGNPTGYLVPSMQYGIVMMFSIGI